MLALTDRLIDIPAVTPGFAPHAVSLRHVLEHEVGSRTYSELTELSDGEIGMLHVANLRNIEGLLKLKPPKKTIIFWDFGDRLYLAHKDGSDRLWGTSVVANIWQNLLFLMSWTNYQQVREGPLHLR